MSHIAKGTTFKYLCDTYTLIERVMMPLDGQLVPYWALTFTNRNGEQFAKFTSEKELVEIEQETGQNILSVSTYGRITAY